MEAVTGGIPLRSHGLASRTKEYHYTPLACHRSIRLLRLLPGASGDELRCNISHYHVDDVPKYRALSYTWGSSSKTCGLVCNESGACLPIRSNLAAALDCLRKDSKTQKLALWVDAVCINQNDNDEKSFQLPLMRTIYREADAVMIWLGQGSEPMTSKFQHDLKWASNSFLAEMKINALRSFTPRADPKTLPAINSRSVKAWVEFFSQSWFQRRWILQEAALASRIIVYYGGYAFPWSYIAGLAEQLALYHECLEDSGPADYAAHVVHTIHVWRYHLSGTHYKSNQAAFEDWGLWKWLKLSFNESKAPSLIEVLYESSLSQCTDSRDRVYSILGLATIDEKMPIPIDYNLSSEAVYHNLTRFLIEDTQSLEVLKYVEHPKSTNGIPSWVPDWSFKPGHNTTWRKVGLTSRLSGPIEPDVQTVFKKYGDRFASFNDKQSVLVVAGRTMATVIAAGQVWNPRDEPSDKASVSSQSGGNNFDKDGIPGLGAALRSWYQLMVDHSHLRELQFWSYLERHRHFMGALRLAHLYNMSESKLASLQRNEGVHDRWNVREYVQLLTHLDHPWIEARDSTNFRTGGFGYLNSQRDGMVALVKRVRNMSFCIVDDGILAVCPASAGVTDRIVLLRGVRTPFVVRPEESGRYSVIGPCYIHLRIYTQEQWTEFEESKLLETFNLE